MKTAKTCDLRVICGVKTLTEERKRFEGIMPPLATFTYDPAGNRLTKTLENGVTTISVYDDANRLSSLTHTKGAVNLATLDYTYDLLNRRTNEQLDGNGGDNFSYDTTDQLIHVDYANGNTTSYTYDAVGNRTQVDDSAFGITNYAAANPLNQYSTFGANGTATYDANGNLSGLNNGAQSWTFAYDSANRLIGNNGGSIVFTFRYDARNRIIKRLLEGVITYQIYDGWNLIADYDANGSLLAKYVHGPNVDEILVKINGNGPVYYHENSLGSTIALTDSSGSVVERYAYDVYGKPTFKDGTGNSIPVSAYENRFLFTGREWFAKLSLYDYRNRVYSPELGRFLQTDPIRFRAKDVNLYRYVANNPVTNKDPFGLFLTGCSKDPCAKLRDKLHKLQKEYDSMLDKMQEKVNKEEECAHNCPDGPINPRTGRHTKDPDCVKKCRETFRPTPDEHKAAADKWGEIVDVSNQMIKLGCDL